MDPHKRSATIEVMSADETVLGKGRFDTDRAGFAAMVAYAKKWPDRRGARRRATRPGKTARHPGPGGADRRPHRRRADEILIITAAYTGMRWGELAGLDRADVDLDNAVIHVDPDVGALHEVDGKLFLGPPKTRGSVRPVALPPFLVDLLREVPDSHDHPTVFCGARGGWQRRSSFNRRARQPAMRSVVPGMHFHDLRHSHRTWLIEDGIPEIAQARRLGHRLPGVRGIYSHVTPAMIQTTVDALQRRWRATQPPGPAGTRPTLTVVPGVAA